MTRRRNARLRGDDWVELPRSYQDADVYESEEEMGNEVTDAGITECIMAENEKDRNGRAEGNGAQSQAGSEDAETVIPELDINELIQLANQLVRDTTSGVGVDNSASGSDEVSNVRIRLPLVTTMSQARHVILQYERMQDSNRLNSSSAEMNRIIWESIIQDDSGLSISGTRMNNSSTNNDGAHGASDNDAVEHGATGETDHRADLHHHHPHHHQSDGNDRIRAIGRRPTLLEVMGLLVVTIFFFAVFQLVSWFVAISAFSDNVFQDVSNFVEYVNEETYYIENEHRFVNTSLVQKFALVIKKEMPYLPDTLWLVLTLVVFTTYTLFTSGIIFTTIFFSTMYLFICCAVRWRNLLDFIVQVIGDR